jgi:DNA processing protein
MEEREYWLGFSVANGIGPKRFNFLLNHFGSARKAWNANESEIEQALGSKIAQKFKFFKKNFNLKLYLKELKKRKVSFLTLKDREYPKLLAESGRPPFVIYVKGSLKVLNEEPALAVVGTRRITTYGEEVTRILVSDLVQSGFIIVSGLALGVDAVASAAAIGSSGKTIAVLGCGVDCVTPRENERLYNSIIEHGGAIVSEFPLGHPPFKGTFPSRNRIIAGLSLGVLVTEGAEDSGSLITANEALKIKRAVFAIPGPITSSLSRGPYSLLKNGGKLVASATEIVEELKIPKTPSFAKASEGQAKFNGTKDEIKILQILENEPLNFDEIARRTDINPSKIGTILSMMEIKGLIKNSAGLFSLIN